LERQIAGTLPEALNDDRIEGCSRKGRRHRTDIGGVRLRDQRVILECKDVARHNSTLAGLH
jgi:hypothetical protein